MKVDEEYLQKVMRTMSHDMGAALRAAAGFSTLLSRQYEEELDEKALYWLSLIRTEGEQAQERLKALSRYSRLYGVEAEKQECDLSAICKRVVSETCVARYPSFSVDVGDLPVVHGYDFLWREYFVELINNSAQYSSAEGCRVYQQELDGSLNIVVEDSGKGIEESQLEYAMLPFRSIGETAGMGMGLPMAKRIIELHDGSLQLDSNNGLKVIAGLPEKVLARAE
jgi:signal transduction histidine kinase